MTKLDQYLQLICVVRDMTINGEALEYLLDDLDLLWYSMSSGEREQASNSIKDLK